MPSSTESGMAEWERQEARDVAADVLARPDCCGRNECYMPAVHQLARFVQRYEAELDAWQRHLDYLESP